MTKVLKLQHSAANSRPRANVAVQSVAGPVRAIVQDARAGHKLTVMHAPSAVQWNCEVLEPVYQQLNPGDRVLVLPPDGDELAIVLGRISSYDVAARNARVAIEAQESLNLRCGESSIELRADGKIMIRGEDVLVRAKGTQRIRAGTVSIN